MNTISILAGTPGWVWGLLVALVALGLSQTRDRRVGAWRLWLLPLSLSLWGLWSLRAVFEALPITAVLWALCAGLVTYAVAGRAPAAGTRWLAESRQWQMPGSWLPLALILLIFSLRYGSGVAGALVPGWNSWWVAQLPLAAALGAICGWLWGRSLQVLQLGQRPTALRVQAS